MKLTKYPALIFSLCIFAFLMALIGCGSDTTTNTTTGGGGWPPTFTYSPGGKFVYTTDSLTPSGVPIRLNRTSADTVQPETLFSGQRCYPFRGATHDVPTNQTTLDLYYVRYDPAGYYYQYGIKRLIDTNLTPSWDLIGDFTKARGTTYDVGNIDYSVIVAVYGLLHFTGTLKGSIVDSTSIQTTAPSPQTIYCYRIELHASVSAPASGSQLAADVYLDYYVGYTAAAYPNNPVGLVELKSRPFSFTFAGTPVLPEPGFDRKLFSYTP